MACLHRTARDFTESRHGLRDGLLVIAAAGDRAADDQSRTDVALHAAELKRFIDLFEADVKNEAAEASKKELQEKQRRDDEARRAREANLAAAQRGQAAEEAAVSECNGKFLSAARGGSSQEMRALAGCLDHKVTTAANRKVAAEWWLRGIRALPEIKTRLQPVLTYEQMAIGAYLSLSQGVQLEIRRILNAEGFLKDAAVATWSIVEQAITRYAHAKG
jgi:hypothetical protein